MEKRSRYDIPLQRDPVRVTIPTLHFSTLSKIYLTHFIREIMARDGRDSRTRFYLRPGTEAREDLFLRAREALDSRSRPRHRRSARRDSISPLCCVVWVEPGIISETSSERSTGRSASLLDPAVCDHPARINPSSVLGVTAKRFTRLYIFILLFALDRRSVRE